jgi:hypothetical protein
MYVCMYMYVMYVCVFEGTRVEMENCAGIEY